jgi:hypothetical protein
VYGTSIQSVETVEHLIFNHPIDDIFSIVKGGDLLQAMDVRNVGWNVVWRNSVAVGCVHSLKWNKSNKPSLHHRRSPEHNINVKRTYLWEERLIVGVAASDYSVRIIAGALSPRVGGVYAPPPTEYKPSRLVNPELLSIS